MNAYLKNVKIILGHHFSWLAVFIFLSACVVGKTDIYKGFELSGSLSNYEQSEIVQRHLDMVNALRIERNLSTLKLSKSLSAAALTHARDISFQKRAWNFGSDYSSPQERAMVAGYVGKVRGENVSETFKGEFDILQIWLKQTLAKQVILDDKAVYLGFGWYQEENGRTWWVQVIGG